MKPFKIKFTYDDEDYIGEVEPLPAMASAGISKNYRVTLNGFLFGIVSCENNKWMVDSEQPQEMVDVVGNYISQHEE